MIFEWLGSRVCFFDCSNRIARIQQHISSIWFLFALMWSKGKAIPFPANRCLDCIYHFFNSVTDLWPNTITRNESHCLNLCITWAGYIDQTACLHTYPGCYMLDTLKSFACHCVFWLKPRHFHEENELMIDCKGWGWAQDFWMPTHGTVAYTCSQQALYTFCMVYWIQPIKSTTYKTQDSTCWLHPKKLGVRPIAHPHYCHHTCKTMQAQYQLR